MSSTIHLEENHMYVYIKDQITPNTYTYI